MSAAVDAAVNRQLLLDLCHNRKQFSGEYIYFVLNDKRIIDQNFRVTGGNDVGLIWLKPILTSIRMIRGLLQLYNYSHAFIIISNISSQHSDESMVSLEWLLFELPLSMSSDGGLGGST